MIYSFKGRKPVIGKNTYISEQAVVIGGVKIGDDCYIGPGAILRGDFGNIEIGAGTAVEEGVVIHSRLTSDCNIGNKVTIGHGAIVHSRFIEDMAVIGMGAIISWDVKVGAGAIIAEGSVVRINQVIPPAVVVGGNPAKVIRPLNDDDKKTGDYGKQVYIDLAHEYLQYGLKRVDFATGLKPH